MALTPEDVVNKRFNPTKFREGYDQDEVDDFLDEVVVELRRLSQENEELRQRLVASDARINELQRSAGQAPAVAAPARPRAIAPPAAVAPVAAAVAVATPGDGTAPTSRRWTPPTPTTCSSSPAVSTRSTCARAWRSATSSSPRATRPPRGSSRRPRTRRVRQIGALDQERAVLEHKVDELRTFEREYRGKLKGYIEGQLHELEATAAIGAGTGQFQAVTAGTGAVDVPAPASGEIPQADAPQTGQTPQPQYQSAPATDYPAPQGQDFSSYPQPEYPGFAGN